MRGRGWFAIVAVTVAAGVFAPAALASYVVYGCTLPNGASAPLDGWTLDDQFA